MRLLEIGFADNWFKFFLYKNKYENLQNYMFEFIV